MKYDETTFKEDRNEIILVLKNIKQDIENIRREVKNIRKDVEDILKDVENINKNTNSDSDSEVSRCKYYSYFEDECCNNITCKECYSCDRHCVCSN